MKYGEKNYPENLLEIYDPPKKLYVMGNVEILNNFGIGIVGTRRPTEYGVQITKSIAYGLARKNINIISGMAKGIDSSAHVSAIMAKGKTIAVLGSGFNNIYPKENIKLFCEIINSGGAVVSEYAEDVKAVPQNFPKRNRIISALSSGIVVTEATKRSGSLITADFALEQGKEVFAIPGNVISRNSEGTNELIKQGAKLTVNIFDILSEFT